MKVGYFIGTQHAADTDIAAALKEHLEQTRMLRDLGFDSVWVAQHYLTGPQQFLQPIPMLARLAAEAGDMLVGTNLLLLPLHNPVDVAEQCATLDIITGGRFVLGVGLGYRDVEYAAFGVERKTRTRRLEESIEVIKRLWTEDEVTFEGSQFKLDRLTIRPKPLQDLRPPIWIGATADPAIKRAALIADAWIATSMTTVSTLAEQVAFYHESRSEAGLPRAQEFARCVELYVAESTEQAFEESAPFITAKYNSYFGWGQDQIVPGESGAGLPFHELAKDRFIIGTPDECIEECLRQRDVLGVTHLIVRSNFPGMPPENAARSVRLFGDEVLPALRAPS